MVVPPTCPDPAKAALRQTFRAARAAYVAGLAPGERARRNTDLVQVLTAHLGPGIVAGYSAYGDEIDPAFDRAMAYPRARRDAPLSFHRCARADLVPGAFGIGCPAADTPVVVPDIVLVPLLAVDARGHRLGQGGGYYDRTLAYLRATGRVVAVGVAWDVQVVDTLPADPWDMALDALATPSGWREFCRHPTSVR